MSHNSLRVLMGSTGSSVKEVTNYPGAATLEAGLVAHAKSDGTVTKAKSDGSPVGVSLGNDLSGGTRTAVCRKGLRVPIKLKTGFNPTIGAIVEIDDAEGYATGDGSKTAVNAIFVSGRLDTTTKGGIAEGATSGETGTIGVAIIDFPGGL